MDAVEATASVAPKLAYAAACWACCRYDEYNCAYACAIDVSTLGKDIGMVGTWAPTDAIAGSGTVGADGGGGSMDIAPALFMSLSPLTVMIPLGAPFIAIDIMEVICCI
jgi:hypothetical protein